MKFLLSLCILAASQLSSAADLFPNSRPKTFNLAERLEFDAAVGGYPIWQGEKKWRIYDLATRSSGGAALPITFGDVGLFQTEGKSLVAVMTTSANLAQNNAGDWTDDPCKRDDMLFKASIGRSFAHVNCVTINHITGFPGNPSGARANLYALLKENGVDIPPTVILLSFTRYASNHRWLSVHILVNPELAGFPRSPETQWGRSPWHKSQAFNDPEKKRFIDGLGVWAMQFGKQMEGAFDKKPDAFVSIPSWRSVSESRVQNDLSKSKITLD